MVDPALIVELYYEVPFVPQMDEVLTEVRKELPGTELGAEGMLAHRDFAVTIEDGSSVPIATFIRPERGIAGPHDFTQTWEWPQAAAVVSRAPFCLSLVQMFGFHQPGQHRLRVMQTVIGALLRTTTPVAAYCASAQKWTRPEDASGREAFLNVRLFQVSDGAAGEVLMDSLGLHALGLPDVELRFTGGEPSTVARSLYGLAYYILDAGDVVADGDTVGTTEEARWRCVHAGSSVEPARVVLRLTAAS